MDNRIKEAKSAEEIMKKYIPHGVINLKAKGKGNGKPQFNYEKKVLIQMMEEYKSQSLPVSAPQNNTGDDWISIEDGLPEEDTKVLIVNSNGKITCSFFSQGRFIVESDRKFVSYWENVTHWMPLPKPPIQQNTIKDAQRTERTRE